MHDCISVHYAEIGTKGKNRPFFEKTLARNIKHALKGLEHGEVRRESGRILVRLSKKSNQGRILERLKDVFGVAYFLPCFSTKAEIKSIEKKSLEVLKGKRPGSFKVDASRSYKKFPLTSVEINQRVGYAIASSYKWKVQMKEPGLVLRLDVLKREALLSYERHEGPGGLPVGVSGKVISLISGGIDSPAASYMAMKRGCEVVFIHFYNERLGRYDKVMSLVKQLAKYQTQTKLYIVPFLSLQNKIIAKMPARERMIVYRRVMLRIAEALAEREWAKALLTGESVGQVASQTLDNLAVISSAVSMPILRPLVGFDKQEIVDLAREIGTYETSIKPYQDCCAYLIAKHPETRGSLKSIEKLERKLDTKKMVKEGMRKIIKEEVK